MRRWLQLEEVATVKRHTKENRQRKTYYQTQFYNDPSGFQSKDSSLFFSSFLKQYMEEALPLLQKSTRQSYVFHFRYLMKGPLSNIKMEHLNSQSVYKWIKWLKKHPTVNNNGRKTFINEYRYKNKKFLFIDMRGEPLKYTAIQAAFNAGFRALNLPWRSTHILRHSYATMALMATRDLPSVQASLGHSSIKMTERYAKIIALLNRDIAEKTTKAFDLFTG